MDRLSVVIAIAAFVCVAGCEDKPPPAAPPGRFVAVPEDPEKQPQLGTFCDAQPGQVLAQPALARGSLPKSRPLWINVWATWCKPCVEEMPLIEQMAGERFKTRPAAHVVFVSADFEDDAITAFRAKHKAMPETLRLRDSQSMRAWFGKLGVDDDAPIPVQIFVSTADKVACVRSGSINDEHREIIEKLLTGS